MRPRKKIRMSGDVDDLTSNDDERDSEWLPENETNDSLNENDTSLPENEFNSTEGFSLNPVKGTKNSTHTIWSMFGVLVKNNKAVDKVKNRIYCIKCFEKKQFKR